MARRTLSISLISLLSLAFLFLTGLAPAAAGPMLASMEEALWDEPPEDAAYIADVFTTDEKWNVKTTFIPGDPINWVLVVENEAELDQEIQVTYDVRGPHGEPVVLWSGTLTTQPGTVYWSLDGTVLFGMAGTHTFTGTGLFQDYHSQVSTTYEVSGNATLYLPLLMQAYDGFFGLLEK